jgi:hypothetical protein
MLSEAGGQPVSLRLRRSWFSPVCPKTDFKVTTSTSSFVTAILEDLTPLLPLSSLWRSLMPHGRIVSIATES